ncbi:MAG: thiamine pyrophosphate-dependent enzyme, partial [Acidobacteriota bacterium]|nr:thiamine pyrophosphate-dependent enzyme [Acidobacteriota bacterium]
MPRAAADPNKLTGLASRFSAFVTERHPLAVQLALDVFDAVGGHKLKPRDHAGIEALRVPFRRELARRLYDTLKAPEGTDHTTPGTTASKRMEQARAELTDAFDGFLRREAIAASLTRTERIEILRGMVLTRAVDNRLKQFFMAGEVRWGDMAFQGKGFRSLGQEAIYAAGIRLKRGAKYRGEDGTWRGDVVAPVIRDIGVALAMRHDPEAVRNVFTAQMGKDGPPMHGKDLHTGDFGWGVLPATAPLAIGALSSAGMAMAFWREGAERVAVCFIGEGGSSLGEWHEAITVCAARKLPAIFCLENNQTALSTPVPDNSAVRVFADKAAGYGLPGISIDGTDPEAIAAAFTWAAERARAGQGPALIEVIAMRMCGHAHHDDMLYLGKDPQPSWEYHALHEGGYANRELYEFWSKRDPLPRYAAQLEAEGVVAHAELDRIKAWARELVEQEAQAVIAMPWPAPETSGVGVFCDEA